MNWLSVSENIFAAVIGALILSAIMWLLPRLLRKQPIDWFELYDSSTVLDSDDYGTTIGYAVVVLNNRTRNVVRNIELITNQTCEKVNVPKGTKYTIEQADGHSLIKLNALQARESIIVECQRRGTGFLAVRKVYVGDEEMGYSKRHKVVRATSIVLPEWVGGIMWMVMAALIPMVLFGVFSAKDVAQKEHADPNNLSVEDNQ